MALGSAFNTFVVFKFIRELTKDWTDMEAYDLGIIDDKGNLLKKASELKTTQEKDAYTLFHRVVWNMKRLLEKLPGGKSKIKSYAAAAWLLRENEDLLKQELAKVLNEEEIVFSNQLFEEVDGGDPTNVSAGVAKKDKPTKLVRRKKKKEDDEMDEISAVKQLLQRRVDEGKKIKKVIRGGVLKRKVVCPEGQVNKGGKCVTKTSQDKQRLKKSAKKRKRTMAGKSLAGALRKRAKSSRKRSSQGLS